MSSKKGRRIDEGVDRSADDRQASRAEAMASLAGAGPKIDLGGESSDEDATLTGSMPAPVDNGAGMALDFTGVGDDATEWDSDECLLFLRQSGFEVLLPYIEKLAAGRISGGLLVTLDKKLLRKSGAPEAATKRFVKAIPKIMAHVPKNYRVGGVKGRGAAASASIHEDTHGSASLSHSRTRAAQVRATPDGATRSDDATASVAQRSATGSGSGQSSPDPQVKVILPSGEAVIAASRLSKINGVDDLRRAAKDPAAAFAFESFGVRVLVETDWHVDLVRLACRNDPPAGSLRLKVEAASGRHASSAAGERKASKSSKKSSRK